MTILHAIPRKMNEICENFRRMYAHIYGFNSNARAEKLTCWWTMTVENPGDQSKIGQ